MGFATDDLAGLLVQPRQEFAGLAEGVVKSFNQDTFESVINVNGTDIPNLPVASGVEALTYRSGDLVLITKWRPRSGRGIATYRVGMGGRVITPGSGAAAKAIEFMRAALAKSTSAEVFGERCRGATVATQQGRSSTLYGDLSTVGPVVSSVPVSDAGSMMVWVGCSGGASSQTSGSGQFGFMSFAVSGATTVLPDDDRSFHVGFFDFDELAAVTSRAVSAVLLTGLNPGLHTLTAKYRQSGSTDQAFFSSRVLLAIGL